MLMLSLEGWLNGLTAVGIFVLGWILGIFFVYQSRKTNAKLLVYLGIFLIPSVWGYYGVSFDFITILLTGTSNYPLSPLHQKLKKSVLKAISEEKGSNEISIPESPYEPAEEWQIPHALEYLFNYYSK